MMSWFNKLEDQAAVNKERMDAKREQLEDLIIKLRRFEHVSVTAVLSSSEMIEPQVENSEVRLATCAEEGAVGREELIFAVAWITVLPTSLITPALLFCRSNLAWT